ncbi:MAG TPA: UDP-N-acetylglucosamine--N-acetylmuramyl-(pentapeptide) pyrophosphoryl-undecaprenol N-acetylglucosamine transferase [Verrucomicrobiae bacterium]|nr:UDP-N-acetylglucosamine--N-acetylmuramyl-(pentapeptide) pyrophosphoryl-undecaprenol N-acetylglucosamine transferase [Verrucomicrobiae bacterium]
MTGCVAIACGGTGGHLFPGVAVADELLARGVEPLLLVSRKKVDEVALKGGRHASVALSAIGWPGLRSPKVMAFAFDLLKTYFECAGIFRERRPVAVLGMGGFTAAVPLWLGRRRRIPTFIHESNAMPGRVTRRLANGVDRVLVGLEACRSRLPSSAAVLVTGTPVRRELFGAARGEGLALFGFDAGRKTVLVMGGSQGARGINDAVLGALSVLGARIAQWQFLHLTGAEDRPRVEDAYRGAGARATVLAFCNRMAAAYAVADVALARSGAASLAEITTARIPSILVPFPFAADNHQWFNAKVFADAGAAIALDQSGLDGRRLAGALGDILDTPGRAEAMRSACESFSCVGAAGRVADAVMGVMHR